MESDGGKCVFKGRLTDSQCVWLGTRDFHEDIAKERWANRCMLLTSSPRSYFPPKQKGSRSYPFIVAFLCFCSSLFPGTTFFVHLPLPIKTQLSDGKPWVHASFKTSFLFHLPYGFSSSSLKQNWIFLPFFPLNPTCPHVWSFCICLPHLSLTVGLCLV